jgi:hypothetical protein
MAEKRGWRWLLAYGQLFGFRNVPSSWGSSGLMLSFFLKKSKIFEEASIFFSFQNFSVTLHGCWNISWHFWTSLTLMLLPHIAEHSPRDLEWRCVDSVLALARGMFGIRAERERRCVWCRFFCSASKDVRVPIRGNMSDPTTDRDVWAGPFAHECSVNHSWSNLRRVRSAMCGGSIRLSSCTSLANFDLLCPPFCACPFSELKWTLHRKLLFVRV